MAQQQQIIPPDQLVTTKYQSIGRCNNYVVLLIIPCLMECKFMGQILVDHALNYALTATVDVLALPVETPENPFISPATLEYIQPFIKIIGYQGDVDKLSTFFTKNLAQPWQTMFKVFNRCLTSRTSGHDQTMINILQIFHDVVNRVYVNYVGLYGETFFTAYSRTKMLSSTLASLNSSLLI
ncbi:hypothetical protein Tco_1043006 [Tanacetum coccineum]|uniref:Uncharacterized protein n=1 Tax=Tanacetum coccineum TaxID=301880 RepID=A0ABQ5GKZ4_9ASTR